ncbi:hypothetical protein TCSYLVIO_003150 [Trypanosoma cruzi]|nr:hypothetical protein TCSYLVIO_003150 [Trypanosoma cruzi]
MIFDKLPLAPHLTADTALQDTVESVLASSHSLLNNARRLSDAGFNGPQSLGEELLVGREDRAASNSAVSESFGLTVGAFHTKLEECRDLLRRVDSERRFFRERALEMQQALEEEGKERKHLRAQIAESQRELRKAQRQAREAQKKTRDMELALAAATEEQMRMRRFLRALPVEKENLLLLVPDRRFEEAFRDKMSAIKYKRRYDRARELHERRSEDVERKLMLMEDKFVETPQDELASSLSNIQHFNSISLLSTSTLPRLSNSMSVSQLAPTGAVRDFLHFQFQLPFSHVTAKDDYIDARIQRSVYKEPLRGLREGLFWLSHRLKRTQDVGLCNMYNVVLESLQGSGNSSAPVMFGPKKAFEVAMEKLQKSHRELLYQLVEVVNSSVTQLLENESRVTVKPTVSRRDVGCSVYSAPPMDVRMNSLEMRLDAQRRKSASFDAESSIAASHAWPKKREIHEKVKMTLQQLITLHDALHNTLQKVRAHCHLDETKPNDAFEELSLAATDVFVEDPRYETKVAEAVEADLQQITQLTDLVLQDAKPPQLARKKGASAAKSIGVDTTKRRQEKQKIAGPGSPPQANRTAGRQSGDAYLAQLASSFTSSPKRGKNFPRRSSGTSEPENTDVAPNNSTGAKYNDVPKAVAAFIVDGPANTQSVTGSYGTPSLPVSKQRRTPSLSRPPGVQRLSSSSLSKVTLPQFMVSEGKKR